MKATLWHNPRCSKSREAMALLREAGAEVVIFEYLKEPLAPDELKRVYAKAGIAPREGLRRKEPGAEALEDASDDEIMAAMMLNPALIERPLVETERGAVLARPPERVREIL